MAGHSQVEYSNAELFTHSGPVQAGAPQTSSIAVWQAFGEVACLSLHGATWQR